MSDTQEQTTDSRRTVKWAQPFASLRYRNYCLLWLSSWTEHMGQFMELAALLWLVHKMTGSPLLLTIVGASRYVPPIILGFFGGILADRMDRRTLLLSTLIWMGLLSICMSVLVFTGLAKVWHIVTLCLLQSSAVSFNHPARQSIIPNLVRPEHLMNVIALNQFSVMGARVLGMVLAGYLLATIGVAPVIATRAVGAILAMIFILFAKVPPTPGAAKKTTAWRNVIEGVRYVQGNPLILTLTFMFVVNQFANITATSLMPAFAEAILNMGAKGYGWLNGIMSAGAFSATLILASLRDFKHKGILFIISGMVLGASLFGFSMSQWFYISLFFLMIFGLTNSMFRGLNTTIIQGTVQDEMRGRVMSLREVGNGIGSAAAILAGGIGEWAGITYAMGSLGVMFFAVLLGISFFLPRVRQME